MPTATLKVAVAGGGTGGHIYPAIALAQALLRRHPAARTLFIGTQRGREASIVPRMGYQLIQLTARPFPRFIMTPAGVLALVATGVAGLQALHVLKKFNPHVVITTGGYISACVAWAAHRLGIPLVLFEANTIPGRANRRSAKWASAICVAFPEAMSSFAGTQAQAVHTGMPVREEMRRLNRESARRELGLSSDAFALLVFGGSQGAQRLNRALWETLPKILNDEPQLHIYHICGEHGWKDAQVIMDELPLTLRDRYHVQSYAHDLPVRIHAADLAVARAGSGSIAELLIAGVPSILVPYPYATYNHQQHNARAIAQAGAAIVVPNERLNGDAMYALTRELMHDVERRTSMRDSALKCAIPDAADRLLDVAFEVAKLI